MSRREKGKRGLWRQGQEEGGCALGVVPAVANCVPTELMGLREKERGRGSMAIPGTQGLPRNAPGPARTPLFPPSWLTRSLSWAVGLEPPLSRDTVMSPEVLLAFKLSECAGRWR